MRSVNTRLGLIIRAQGRAREGRLTHLFVNIAQSEIGKRNSNRIIYVSLFKDRQMQNHHLKQE